MFANQVRFIPAPARQAPPPWAVLLVKCCAVGLLALPPAMPLLTVGSFALGPRAESFRRVAFFASIGVWVAMFVLAQYLITVYPPVPRR